MFGIISSFDFNSLVELYGLPAFHIREGELRQALVEASRVQLDFLILDVSFSNYIEEELHQYRVQRPFTRIILIAPGREPGDPILAKLVGMGIYDIVSEEGESLEQELLNRIKTPANYTQGARWLQVGHLSFKQNRKAQDSIKEILIQQRPLGLTTIAIAGAGTGAGVSHLSLAIAAHLAQSNHRVVLAEWPLGGKPSIESQYAYLSAIGAVYKESRMNSIEIQTAHISGFDILLSARQFRSIEHIFPLIATENYNYLVLDLGELKPEKIAEMDRAALAILVVSSAPYRVEKFLPIIDEDDTSLYIPNLLRWKIALNLAADREAKWFVNSFSKFLGKIYPIPYMVNSHEYAELFNEILQPVLPVNLPRKKKPFWKFR